MLHRDWRLEVAQCCSHPDDTALHKAAPRAIRHVEQEGAGDWNSSMTISRARRGTRTWTVEEKNPAYHAAKVLLHEVGVFPDSLRDGAEDDALLRELLLERCGNGL